MPTWCEAGQQLSADLGTCWNRIQTGHPVHTLREKLKEGRGTTGAHGHMTGKEWAGGTCPLMAGELTEVVTAIQLPGRRD